MKSVLAGLCAAFLFHILPAQALAAIHVVSTPLDDVANPPAGSLRQLITTVAQSGDSVYIPEGMTVKLKGNLVIPAGLNDVEVGADLIDLKERARISAPTPSSRQPRVEIRVQAQRCVFNNLDFHNCSIIADGSMANVNEVRFHDGYFTGYGAVEAYDLQKITIVACIFKVENRAGERAPITVDNCQQVSLTDGRINTGGAPAIVEVLSKTLTIQDWDTNRSIYCRPFAATINKNNVAKSIIAVMRLPLDGNTERDPETEPILLNENTAGAVIVEGSGVTVTNNILSGNTTSRGDYKLPGELMELSPEPFHVLTLEPSEGVGAVTVTGNTISGGRVGIDVDCNGTFGQLVVSNNTISATGTGIRAVGVAPIDYAHITGNKITGARVCGIEHRLFGALSVVIEENELNRCGLVGGKGAIRIEGGSPADVRANEITSCKPGIAVVSVVKAGQFPADPIVAPRVLMRENNLFFCEVAGIDVLSPQAAVALPESGDPTDLQLGVASNNITSSKGPGLRLRAGVYVNAESNLIERSAGPGVRVDDGSYLLSTANIVERNAGPGFHFRGVPAPFSGPNLPYSGDCSQDKIQHNSGAGVVVGKGSLVILSRLSCSNNGGPGIDLLPAGVTPNKITKSGNGNMPWPEELVFDAEARMIRGLTLPGADIQLFRSEPKALRRGNPKNGEGMTFIADAVALGDGRFAIPSGPCQEGDFFTVVASHPETSAVSEFSPNIACIPMPPVQRVSIRSDRGEANGTSLAGTAGFNDVGEPASRNVTSNGRFVLFHSDATNLVNNDTNGLRDLFVRDLVAGTTERVNVSIGGAETGNNASDSPSTTSHGSISDDGRYVVFSSDATNLVSGDINRANDIFIRDRETNTTFAVTDPTQQPVPFPNEAEYYHGGFDPAISGDGNFVAFSTNDQNFAGAVGMVVWSRQTGQFEQVNVNQNGDSVGYVGYDFTDPRFSHNGRYLVFETGVQLTSVPGGGIYLRDRQLGITELITQREVGGNPTGFGGGDGTVSDDGRYVAFATTVSLLAEDTDNFVDVYVKDRQTGLFHLASKPPADPYNANKLASVGISGNGRWVAFSMWAGIDTGTFTLTDFVIFVHDLQTGETKRVSTGNAGEANNTTTNPSLSADGRFMVFHSFANNLTASDTNNANDVFIRDRAEEIAEPMP